MSITSGALSVQAILDVESTCKFHFPLTVVRLVFKHFFMASPPVSCGFCGEFGVKAVLDTEFTGKFPS